jgi:hypothetical protein
MLPLATGYHLGMSAGPESSPYEAWLRALRDLTADAERLAAWRDQRNAFAHRLGTALTEPHPPAPTATGPALYGVYLPTTGLCYIGQTKESERRLRDLPIGESHHVGMTVPPELWSRVIVIQWRQLLPLVPAAERGLANEDPETCGKALEHLMICERHPVINSYARRNGQFRARSPERSQSTGARAAPNFPGLFKAVLTSWTDLELAPTDSPHYSTSGRVIVPGVLS